MKKYLGLFVAAALSLMLSSCNLPGERKNDDDFVPNLDYSTDTPSDEEEIINYAWVLEPSISAENIIVFDGSQVDPDHIESDMYERTAVLCVNGLYGLINYKGETVIEPAYKYYYVCPCGQIALYNITDEENDVREYRTLDEDGKVTSSFYPHESPKIEYYYDTDDDKLYYAREAEDWSVKEYTEKKTVVAEKAEVAQVFGGYELVEPDSAPKYGLVKQGEVILDFEYDHYYAPSYKGAGVTAIALEKDGKWGYVNASGEEIIGFKCDEVFSSYNGEMSDSLDSGHPYLFSEDFAAVSVNYSFGYYGIDGKLLVKTNEFEQARPVHHGKAWVCSKGLWGIIRFGEEEEEEEIVTTTTTTTTTSSQTWGTWQTTTESEEETGYEPETDWTDTDWQDPNYTEPNTDWTDTDWQDPDYTEPNTDWTDTDWQDPNYTEPPVDDPVEW